MRFMAAFACSIALAAPAASAQRTTATQILDLQQDDEKGQLRAIAGERELFTYNYGEEWDLPHFHPLNTPSGKNLLVQKTEPYPHHRSFWVSDTVVRDGVKGDIYNAYYSGVKTGDNTYTAPFNTTARHDSFELTTSTPGLAVIKEKLVWETSRTQTAYPMLDEHREIIVHALENGNYLMDFSFELRAEYGDVRFISDAVHYAWPYLRLNSTFNGEGGGVITASNGATGQEATNMNEHSEEAIDWIDYSNTVDGVAEGVAIFQRSGDEYGEGKRKWLTREYGTFGPRRPDDKSGKPFVLKQGESLAQRVGIFVHRGDVSSGNVSDVYDSYVKGELDR